MSAPPGKFALIRHQPYAHAQQFKRANKTLRTLKTYLGRTIRDITRQIAGEDDLMDIFRKDLHLAGRVLNLFSSGWTCPHELARQTHTSFKAFSESAHDACGHPGL